MAMVSLVWTWGSTEDERERTYPCDGLLLDADVRCWRAVDVDAPPATLFRWLCQLRVAPYSYDWIDNFGRRSPRELTPGLDHLALGQRFMTIFELVDFAPNRHITLRTKSARGLFGDVAVTYEVVPVGPARSRLVAKLLWKTPGRGPWSWLLRRGGAAGDWVMMRKQLLTLKARAEETALSVGSRTWINGPRSLLPPPRRPIGPR